MKKTIKTAMFAVAVVAAGFGSVKAYDAYQLNENSLMSDNLEALSNGEGNTDAKYQTMDYSCPSPYWWWPSSLKLNCTSYDTHVSCTKDCD